MIQRIQTLYLALVVITTFCLCFFSISLCLDMDGNPVYLSKEPLYFILCMTSGLLAFVTIFLFKNRQLQFVLGRLNILLNLILLGLFVYRLLGLSGETTTVSMKGIGALLPVLSIVLLVLSNKAIKRDEDLVKSVDRLR